MFLHTAVDGYSRLAYTEALPDEKAATAIGFMFRARAFFAAHGISHIQRIVTDNGACYRATDFSKVLLGARHPRITADIDAAFSALETGNPDDRGRREMLIVHPQAPQGVRGLAPATQVSLGTLLPGESTTPVRANTTGLSMCIAGAGTIDIGNRTMHVVQQDVWTKPSVAMETLSNNGSTAFRYLRYTNAALLESISAFYEDLGSTVERSDAAPTSDKRRAKDLAPAIELGYGSQLLPYEHIIDPDRVTDAPLLFAWADVSKHLSGVLGLKTGYTGRPLFCLYNPRPGGSTAPHPRSLRRSPQSVAISPAEPTGT